MEGEVPSPYPHMNTDQQKKLTNPNHCPQSRRRYQKKLAVPGRYTHVITCQHSWKYRNGTQQRKPYGLGCFLLGDIKYQRKQTNKSNLSTQFVVLTVVKEIKLEFPDWYPHANTD